MARWKHSPIEQVELSPGIVDQDDLVLQEAITNEGVHPASVLGGKSAPVAGERVKAPEFVRGDREALDGCWKGRGLLSIAEAGHLTASIAVDLQVQFLGTLEVDCGRIDAGIEQM